MSENMPGLTVNTLVSSQFAGIVIDSFQVGLLRQHHSLLDQRIQVLGMVYHRDREEIIIFKAIQTNRAGGYDDFRLT